MTNAREISVEYLARVEGEGSMRVKVVDDQIEDVEFSIFEPPRFFEAFLRGRPYTCLLYTSDAADECPAV